jgi:hypothetical protein
MLENGGKQHPVLLELGSLFWRMLKEENKKSTHFPSRRHDADGGSRQEREMPNLSKVENGHKSVGK